MLRRVAAFLLVTTIPATARAEEPAPRVEAAPDLPHASVRYNPLGLLIGRVSGDIEVWPTNSLSVVATPWAAKYDQGAETGDKGEHSSSHLQLTGLELAVRYWPIRMRAGPFTFAPFVGLDGGGAWGSLETTTTGASFSPSTSSQGSTPIQQVIIAGEAGVALYAMPFIVQAGFGAQWTQSLGTDPHGPTFWDCSWVCGDGTHFYYGNGFLPRVLLSAGLAF